MDSAGHGERHAERACYDQAIPGDRIFSRSALYWASGDACRMPPIRGPPPRRDDGGTWAILAASPGRWSDVADSHDWLIPRGANGNSIVSLSLVPAMKTSNRTALQYSTIALVIAGAIAPWAGAADDPTPPKAAGAYTLDEALQQLRVYPKDAYLQYVTLQLARRENQLADTAAQVDRIAGNEEWMQRAGRRNDVDLFSIFTGALAV